MFGGVSVFCWDFAPISNVLRKPNALGKKSNSVMKSSSGPESQIGVIGHLWRVSLHMLILQNVMLHLDEGYFILIEDPVPTIELHQRQFQMFLYSFIINLYSRSLLESRIALIIKTRSWEKQVLVNGISFKINRQRRANMGCRCPGTESMWYSSQVVTLFANGSAKSTVPSDR